jgi:hypothetical protein
MPLAAYFRNVGAALLALLLIANFYLPPSPVAQGAATYPPVIRIHSEQRLPAPIVFDTGDLCGRRTSAMGQESSGSAGRPRDTGRSHRRCRSARRIRADTSPGVASRGID